MTRSAAIQDRVAGAILDAAADLLARGGEPPSMNEVAAAAGPEARQGGQGLVERPVLTPRSATLVPEHAPALRPAAPTRPSSRFQKSSRKCCSETVVTPSRPDLPCARQLGTPDSPAYSAGPIICGGLRQAA